MEITRIISDKKNSMTGCKIPTIAFLGDSVTQGCFELDMKADGGIENVYDKDSAYHNYVAKILSVLFPGIPINIINAGVAGETALGGEKMLERDVLAFHPDLTVVCFGLNDSDTGMENIETYTSALRNIFHRLKEAGSEIIFMTPNMMNTKVSMLLKEDFMKKVAVKTQQIQNNGVLDSYMEAAKKVCSECDVIVCDCYAKWKKMNEKGVDITELLANKLNHPTREMHWLFAAMLVDTMFEN